jgi:hypothetical protein
MIEGRNFVRGREQARQNKMGPDALRLNGALFRCSRNFCDVADDISAKERLAFASPRRACWSMMFERPFHPGVQSGNGVVTLVARSHIS